MRRLVPTNAVAGLAELVWNSLDAEATEVRIVVERNDLQGVREVLVADDGHGFGPEEMQDAMSSLGGSWKASKTDKKTKNGKRDLHGQKGEGRFRALAVGDIIRWESVTESDGRRILTTCTIRGDQPTRYEWDSEPTGRPVGTAVTVSAGMRPPNALLSDGASSRLLGGLAQYLKRHQDVSVYFDGERLDASDLFAERKELDVDYVDDHGPLGVTVIEWKQSADGSLFLCDDNEISLQQIRSELRAPGIQFTAYANWAGFRAYETSLGLAEMQNPEIEAPIAAAREALRDYFATRATERKRQILNDWREEGVYPYQEQPENIAERAQQAMFNAVAFETADTINSIRDRKAKSLSLQAMKLALAHDPSAVGAVIGDLLSLSSEEFRGLHELLKRTSLTSLVAAMTRVTDRLLYLRSLEQLIFDEDISARVLETTQLHKIIESEPWLFGEEYALHLSNRGLTEVLRKHLALLGRAELATEPVTDEQGRRRLVDLMFGRALETNQNRLQHLIVEIKRPSTTLSKTELDQVKDYANAVIADPQFDHESTDWVFYLVGRDLDRYVEGEVNQGNRPVGLAFETNDGSFRVWVKRWSTLIGEARHRLMFIRDQLEYDPTAEEALEYLEQNYPDAVPDLRVASDAAA